jgi:uncharacterized protein
MTSAFDFHARLRPGQTAVPELLDRMDRAGVARALVSVGGTVDLDRLSAQIVEGGGGDVPVDNDQLWRQVTQSSGRLLPAYFGNPHRPAAEYRREADRFRALEVSPAVHGVGFDHPGLRNLVEAAGEAGHCVYTVCVPGQGAGVRDLIRLARDHPHTTFVFGHCGFITVDAYALGAIAGQPNIVAETSGCFALTVHIALTRLGPDRVLFGSEHPLQHPAVELAKLASLDLPPDTWDKVVRTNAHRLVNEPV